MKKVLFALLVSLAATIGMAPMAYADGGFPSGWEADSLLAAQSSQLTTQATDVDCVLGQEYAGNKGNGVPVNLRFRVSGHMHVFAQVRTSAKNYSIRINDALGNTISTANTTMQTVNANGDEYVYSHSANLESGEYSLNINSGSGSKFTALITAEPVVSLDRPSITSASCPSPNTLTVSASTVADAMSYEYQYGVKADFSDAKTVVHPATTYRASELAGDKYYYVRVRPFTAYNDGLSVYGNWSRAQAVYVEPTPNTVQISTKSKTLKRSALKKKNQSFLVIADDVAGADLTYKLSPVSSRAKKYVSINASTGAITVKKGLAKGTYKMTVKVSAKAVGLYGAASTSKQLSLTVK